MGIKPVDPILYFGIFAGFLPLLAEKNEPVYDSFDQLCPNENCVVYDRKKDLLLYHDTDHLTVEAGKFLVPHFDNWLRQTFILN